MRIETLAVHAGHSADPATGAITPPIHLSTTFEREADGQYPAGLVYSRYANPDRLAREECLAQLEGGAGAAWFVSGSAATGGGRHWLAVGAYLLATGLAFFVTAGFVRSSL